MSTNAYSKTVKLSDSNRTVEVGATQVKNNLKNKLNNSPIAQEEAGQREQLALNLNMVTEQYQVTAKIDDEVAAELNASASTDNFTGDGTTQTFSLSQVTGNEIVYVNGNFLSEMRYEIDEQNLEITFEDPITDGASVEVVHALSKEDIKDKVKAIFLSKDIVTLEYGSESPEGFLDQMEITENADQDTSVYTIKTRLLISSDMEEDSGGQ